MVILTININNFTFQKIILKNGVHMKRFIFLLFLITILESCVIPSQQIPTQILKEEKINSAQQVYKEAVNKNTRSKNLSKEKTKDLGSYDENLGQAVQRLGRKMALIIGVEYPPPYTLEWTVREANMINKTLKDVYGFETDVLTGNVSKQQVLIAFDNLKQKASNSDDQILVFFSGHGYQEPNNPDVGYLMPSDGNRSSPMATCVSMNQIQILSKSLSARHGLFIIDACYSGIIGGFGTMSAHQDTMTMVRSYMSMKARQVMTAGRSNEQALMSAERRMSVYSFYLHRGLNEEGGFFRADKDFNNVITIRELQDYVEKKVKTETSYRQNPRIFDFTENDGKFVFVPKDFQKRWLASLKNNQINKKTFIPPPVQPAPENENSQITEIKQSESSMSGNGGLALYAKPEGVIATVTWPNGHRVSYKCPKNIPNLPPGKYHIIFSKPLYHPSKDVVIEVGQTIKRLTMTLKPNFGWFSIQVKPEKASIYLNEQYLGDAPISDRKKQSGHYQLRIQAPMYKTDRREIIIQDGQRHNIDIQLKPAYGFLHVTSNIDGASVIIDGQPKGQTPFKEKLSSGSYYLKINHNDYLTIPEQQIIIQDNKTTAKHFQLKPDFGILDINGSPDNSQIFVNDVKKGRLPKTLRMKPGEYSIKVSLDESSWVPRQFNVKIVRGETISLNANLEKKTGGLNIYTEPNTGNAKVFLDNSEDERCMAPCTLDKIPVGKVILTCKDETISPILVGQKSVMVRWKQIDSVTVNLEEIKSGYYGQNVWGGKQIKLRSEYVTLDYDDVQAMIKKYNFFDKFKNQSGNFENDFVDNGDGTVLDRRTGLMWQKSGSDDYMPYENAERYVQQLNQRRFAGYNDWRLPTIEELSSLMENKKMNRGLYIERVFDNKQRWCWSGDQKRSSGSRWVVDFSNGDADWLLVSSDYYVRGVRFGQ